MKPTSVHQAKPFLAPVLLAAAVFASASEAAVFIPISQSRTVLAQTQAQATTYYGTGFPMPLVQSTDLQVSTSLGEFNTVAQSYSESNTRTEDISGAIGIGSSSVTLTSDISPQIMTAKAALSGHAENYIANAKAWAKAEFATSFEVSSATDFSLRLNLRHSAPPHGGDWSAFSVKLISNLPNAPWNLPLMFEKTDYHVGSMSDASVNETFVENWQLDPGVTYSLLTIVWFEVSTSGSLSYSYSHSGSFDLTLSIPEPAASTPLLLLSAFASTPFLRRFRGF